MFGQSANLTLGQTAQPNAVLQGNHGASSRANAWPRPPRGLLDSQQPRARAGRGTRPCRALQHHVALHPICNIGRRQVQCALGDREHPGSSMLFGNFWWGENAFPGSHRLFRCRLGLQLQGA
jgi:hypothetical protein